MDAAPKTLYFKLKQDASRDLPLDLLPSGWHLAQPISGRERQIFYDTFQWQAFEKGLTIVKKKGTLFLADLETGIETASAELDGNPAAFFSDTLPAGSARELLCRCTQIRAFVRLCTIERRFTKSRILDDNDKTVGTFTTEELAPGGTKGDAPFIQLFSLSALKGFKEEIALVEKSFSQHEKLCEALEYRELFQLIMLENGRAVHDYSSKIQLTLDPVAPIHENARRLLQFTLLVMRLNESGIIKDIDSEFLHDYRVAIRRTRSILKQLKGVFEPTATDHFLNTFRELGKRTNVLRDLDVSILRKSSYFRSLPPVLHPSLEQFFRDIEAMRSREHKRFSTYLSSSAYRSSLARWEEFINLEKLPDTSVAPNAPLSTMTVAMTTIKKARKKVIRHGRKVSHEATDTELHRLRIECKKLRYLLEFFSSIYPHKTILPVIRHLKELQDNLGNFVDFGVQLHSLQQRLASIPCNSDNSSLAASIGGLLTALYRRQEEARRKFHKTFRQFDNEETLRLFHKLLTHTH